MLGLGLDGYLGLRAAQAAAPAREHGSTFGRAKNCILLFLYGSPSQLEWCDMKPDAPEEIRGELGGIRSRLPGCDVCELFPNMARVMDKMTVVRSMTHPHPIHGVAYATTGIPNIDVAMELNPRDGRHWPYIGSVVEHVQRNGGGAGRRREMPSNIALPFPFSSRRVGEVPRAGCGPDGPHRRDGNGSAGVAEGYFGDDVSPSGNRWGDVVARSQRATHADRARWAGGAGGVGVGIVSRSRKNGIGDVYFSISGRIAGSSRWVSEKRGGYGDASAKRIAECYFSTIDSKSARYSMRKAAS